MRTTACVQTTPPPLGEIGEGAPSLIFPEGRGGGVCTQAMRTTGSPDYCATPIKSLVFPSCGLSSIASSKRLS